LNVNSLSSIEYFRKQAKALTRSVAAADAEALRRIEKYLKASSSRGLTNCQYVIAREHGFSKWEDLVQADDIERRLAITMDREPVLNDHGLGIWDGHLKRPPDERARILQDDRCQLRENVKDVRRTLEWLLANLPPAKTLRRPVGSYRLKHVAEGDIGYITNGVFIAAGLIAGYPHRFYDEPNLSFGVSVRALKAIDARQEAAGTRCF
jgi:hypothetical protein